MELGRLTDGSGRRRTQCWNVTFLRWYSSAASWRLPATWGRSPPNSIQHIAPKKFYPEWQRRPC